MGYKSDYLSIINDSNLQIFKKIFNDRDDYVNYGIQKIEFRKTTGNLPYIYFSVDYKKAGDEGEIVCAVLLLLHVDLSNYFKKLTSSFLFLPIIAEPISFPENIKKYINKEISINHELIHLKDLIELYNNEPNYQQKRIDNNINNCTNEEEIKKSIDFELSELFYLEPKAFKYVFEQGENTLYEIFIGRTLKYKCTNYNEYLQLQLVRYIGIIEKKYENKLKEIKIEKKSIFEDCFNKLGNNVFGNNPYEKYKTISKEYIEKLLTFTIKELKLKK